jgi:hypothetical protein
VRRKREKRRSAPGNVSPEAATHNELGPLSQKFRQFADEARTYGGPLYVVLSTRIANDEELLGIARHVCRPPVPNVFLAAVHFLLAEAREHELSAFYASLCDVPRPPAEAYPAFRDFILSNTARLIPLLETRITQTNEVSRCSFLLPAFTAVQQSAGGGPLALIDVGCSAGLHLRWDHYHYDYGVAQVGDPRAAVSIRCELRGPVMPPLPGSFPECRYRVGIDLSPVDLRDPIERRWFEALIWPEHADRRRLASAAIDELLCDPPEIVKGDAVEVLAAELAAVPLGTALVVFNSAALCQGGAAEQKAIADVLIAFSFRRPIHWLYCEGEEVLLRALDRGTMVETKLANKDGHGRWLEWLGCTERGY